MHAMMVADVVALVGPKRRHDLGRGRGAPQRRKWVGDAGRIAVCRPGRRCRPVQKVRLPSYGLLSSTEIVGADRAGADDGRVVDPPPPSRPGTGCRPRACRAAAALWSADSACRSSRRPVDTTGGGGKFRHP
jgi:hypothetical protein